MNIDGSRVLQYEVLVIELLTTDYMQSSHPALCMFVDVGLRLHAVRGHALLIDINITQPHNPALLYYSLCATGKGEARQNWSMVIPKMAALVTGTISTLRTTDPVPADSRQ